MTTATQEKINHAEQNAKGWAESIVQMVAALECDYDRLEELRGEREAAKDSAYESPDVDGAFGFKGCDSDQYATMHAAEAAALAAWDEENGAELAELEAACTIDGDKMKDADGARERIDGSPLSLQLRSGWYSPGDADAARQPEEFELLLSTGGPALRIVGELDEHGQPTHAYMQWQDWGTPWTEFFGIERETLLAFCRCFYFGE